MFTKRQNMILNILSERQDTYLNSYEIASAVSCSSKTVQNEIKTLNALLKKTEIQIYSQVGKGYYLNSEDRRKLNRMQGTYGKEGPESNFRMNAILSHLMFDPGYINISRLADNLFISLSTMKKEIRFIEQLVLKYDLHLETKYNRGIRLLGSERDKRRCMIGCALVDTLQKGDDSAKITSEVGAIVLESLTHYKCVVSDLLLQNLIFHITLSMNRFRSGFTIERIEGQPDHQSSEYKISEDIYRKLEKRYLLSFSDSEIAYLAVNLKAKRLYEDDILVNDEIDGYVTEVLNEIQRRMHLDFTYDLELRLSLGLHFVPLLYRMKYKMQLKNCMARDIKNNFIMAYDLAVLASGWLQKKTNIRVSEDETSYLAVHFNLALEKRLYSSPSKKILIVSSSRRGDVLLLKYQLAQRFENKISDVEVINLSELDNLDIRKYDLCFTTSRVQDERLKDAIPIHYFLEESDFKVIEKALFQTAQFSMSKLLDRSLFFSKLNCLKKQDVLKKMCSEIQLQSQLKQDILESVLEREKLGYTAYDSLVAIPHTDGAIAPATVVSVAVLSKPIDWGGSKAQLIIMICAAPDQNRELKDLYEKLTKLIVDKHAVQSIIENPNFEHFIEIFEK